MLYSQVRNDIGLMLAAFTLLCVVCMFRLMVRIGREGVEHPGTTRKALVSISGLAVLIVLAWAVGIMFAQ